MKTVKLGSIALLLIELSLQTFGVPQAIASEENAFQTPSGNIRCLANSTFLFCVLIENTAKIPPMPKNCDGGGWGYAFSLPSNARVRRGCPTDTLNTGYPVLKYGQTWRSGDFTCTVKTTALTCTNRIKHGWQLSRKRQHFF